MLKIQVYLSFKYLLDSQNKEISIPKLAVHEIQPIQMNLRHKQSFIELLTHLKNAKLKQSKLTSRSSTSISYKRNPSETVIK